MVLHFYNGINSFTEHVIGMCQFVGLCLFTMCYLFLQKLHKSADQFADSVLFTLSLPAGYLNMIYLITG